LKENWEINWEDYYKILGVNHASDDTGIKKAYLYKAWLLSIDHMIGAPDYAKLRAQEELKKVNYANDVLKDPEKRKNYDREYLRRMGKSEYNSVHSQPMIKPKPVVNPAIIRFMDVAPGETNTGSFTVENSGGPYSRIFLSNPNSWINIVSQKPLYATGKLPLLVEIEVKVGDWGKTYVDNIIVRLDDIETHIRVELQTRPKIEKINQQEQSWENKTQSPGFDSEEPVETYPRKGDKQTVKKPKIEVYPKVINLENSLPYVKRTASFFIRNVGGPYKKILIGQTPEWVKIINTKNLFDGNKLPLRIQLEAVGIQWNKEYSTEIRIRLDASETLVKIRLRTEKKPK